MRRLQTRASFALGLSTQLAAIWLSLTPGLVFCVEQDGRVSLEASAEGVLCGGASPGSGPACDRLALAEPASPHCSDCRDVPLKLAGFAALAPQRDAKESPALAAAVPGLAALRTVRQIQRPVSPRAPRLSLQRSTVLRL